MRSIGFRVSPKVVYFAICDKSDTEINILTIDCIKVPLSFSMPDALSFIRTTILSIVMEFNIGVAGIRTIEDNAQKISISRVYIEGVIQELISNCSIKRYFAGKKHTIARLMGIPLQDLSKKLEGKEDIFGVEGWVDFLSEERESIFCAIAAFSL